MRNRLTITLTAIACCVMCRAASGVDSQALENNVLVEYSSSGADVTYASNLDGLLTVQISGAHVSIIQDASIASEVLYTLQGSSSDGSFWMDGEYKISVILNGLTLTCADSAAINIRDGKRIAVEIADGTVNTLVDGSGGSQKGCFIVNGHTEVRGGGELNITGNVKHAFFGDEYLELKKSAGTINILGAKKDGINVNEYMLMNGGTVNISGVGDDGIQVSYAGDGTEGDGSVTINAGEINIEVTATAAKGLKCDDNLTIAGGTINITTSGSAEYDDDDNDISACSCIKADGDISISDGEIILSSTGDGGKGINGSGDITVSDGKIAVATSGATYSDNGHSTTARGIKADGHITLDGGLLLVNSPEDAAALHCDSAFTVNGGTLVALGGSSTQADATTSEQPTLTLSGATYAEGDYIALSDGEGTYLFAYRLQRSYSAAELVVSDGEMTAGGTYAVESGVEVSGGTSWQGYIDDASSITSSVSKVEVAADCDGAEQWYTIDGRAANSTSVPGAYIVKRNGKSAKVVVR